MKKSLTLNNNWDISLDENGNFSFCDEKYAIAQNVACAVRAFTKDMYFNQNDGIPHFVTDISNNKNINTTLLNYYVAREAKRFSEVKTAKITNITVKNRVMQGLLEIVLQNDEVINVTI